VDIIASFVGITRKMFLDNTLWAPFRFEQGSEKVAGCAKTEIQPWTRLDGTFFPTEGESEFTLPALGLSMRGA
jgi:hypothetical protein